jgi:hypothetical protein
MWKKKFYELAADAAKNQARNVFIYYIMKRTNVQLSEREKAKGKGTLSI